jgi:hypothetical protein
MGRDDPPRDAPPLAPDCFANKRCVLPLASGAKPPQAGEDDA